MNAGQRAFAILRADLDAKKSGWIPTRCEFERHLNDLPFPAGVGEHGSGRRSANYGSWLKTHNPAQFSAQYEAWRDAQ